MKDPELFTDDVERETVRLHSNSIKSINDIVDLKIRALINVLSRYAREDGD